MSFGARPSSAASSRGGGSVKSVQYSRPPSRRGLNSSRQHPTAGCDGRPYMNGAQPGVDEVPEGNLNNSFKFRPPLPSSNEQENQQHTISTAADPDLINAAGGSGRSNNNTGIDVDPANGGWDMSFDEFKRMVESQFAVAISVDELQCLQTQFPGQTPGTVDTYKFADALSKKPLFGLDPTRGCFNFLPTHKTDCEIHHIESQIRQRIEDRCKVAGNYQYQSAYRMLCDDTYRIAGGMSREDLKLRMSELIGVALSDQETNFLFNKYVGANGKVDIRVMVKRLLRPSEDEGWFMLTAQLHEPVVKSRISESARFKHVEGMSVPNPAPSTGEFPSCLKHFRWDLAKLVEKIKSKINEHAKGHAGYLFLAACKIFRHELPDRKNDMINYKELQDIIRFKFSLTCEEEQSKALFELLVPGCGGVLPIPELVRRLVPRDYQEVSWYSTRESTDMAGYVRDKPDQVVMQAKEVTKHNWNIDIIEGKIKEKIDERVGGIGGGFEVQAAYRLFLDGRNSGITKARFKAHMHDKFAIVLTDDEISAIYMKHDPTGTGFIDLFKFIKSLVGKPAEPEPMFEGRETYEFHLSCRAPMKKDAMDVPGWKVANWSVHHFEEELRNKVWAKSNQDGGRFAYKSAVSLFRSANPDHLDRSNLTRETMKFVVFRKFDIIMDEKLLDAVFAKYATPGTGKVPVHKLVRVLLPPAWDGSHHLVPKTEDQGLATKTLLHQVFEATGKRREIISLNGAACAIPPKDDDQTVLVRVVTGPKGGDGLNETLKTSLKTTVDTVKLSAVPAAAGIAPGAKTTVADLINPKEQRPPAPPRLPPDTTATQPSTSIAPVDSPDIMTLRRNLQERQAELDARERQLSDREIALGTKEAAVGTRENTHSRPMQLALQAKAERIAQEKMAPRSTASKSRPQRPQTARASTPSRPGSARPLTGRQVVLNDSPEVDARQQSSAGRPKTAADLQKLFAKLVEAKTRVKIAERNRQHSGPRPGSAHDMPSAHFKSRYNDLDRYLMQQHQEEAPGREVSARYERPVPY